MRSKLDAKQKQKQTRALDTDLADSTINRFQRIYGYNRVLFSILDTTLPQGEDFSKLQDTPISIRGQKRWEQTRRIHTAC